jgi:membrane protease YdiL (CAAX protease family)
MKPLRAIVLYVFATLVVGALLAPWLYWSGTWVTQSLNVENFPFHRYFNRAVMLVAFAGLWPFVRSLGTRRWSDVGLKRKSGGWSEFSGGFVVGLASIALLAAAAMVVGSQQWKGDLTTAKISSALASCLATGLIVGIIEELFFRGVAYGELRRALPVAPALLLTSFAYSIVHFLKPARVADGYDIQWWSGFDVLATCGQSSFSSPTFWPYLTTLVLAGGVLALAFERTGALYLPMGLHAGWVFALQLNPKLFQDGGVAEFWFGENRLENGWLCVPLLAVILLTLAWRLRGKVPKFENGGVLK